MRRLVWLLIAGAQASTTQVRILDATLVAIAEPILLLNASRKPTGFATVVLAVQLLGAVVAFSFALRRGPDPPAAPGEPVPPAADIEPIPEAVS